MISKRICVVGLGYIGLPTAALLANRNYKVHGVDIIQETVNTINQGRIHIVEPDLDTFVRSAVNSGNLVADIKPDYADVFIIAVPTPFNENHVPNIDYVIEATKSIAPYVKESNIIILESTSPIGTTQKIDATLANLGLDTSLVHIAHCPERVLPGHIMRELVENDRVVGGLNEKATELVSEFYKSFVKGEVLKTDSKTAEMAKLTENAYRDTNIAFANELSILCDQFEIDVWELISLTNRHPRVNILRPSPGVGGHCIAVDPWFIVHSGGDKAKLIRTSREVNNYKTEWTIEKIKNEALLFEKENSRKPKIACMGLAFKPNIDDLRESPSLHIVRVLSIDNTIIAVEPNITANSEFEIVDYSLAIEQADIIVFLVAHDEFRNLNVDNKIVLDFCGWNK